MTRGQFIRLFLGSDNTATPAKVIGSAKQLTLHISCQMENVTTKDSGDSGWDVQTVTGISYDISTNALVRGADTITSATQAQDLGNLEDIYEGATPVKFQIANVSGDNNRTKGAVIISGSVIINQLSISAQNRQAAEYTASMTGYGDYVVGA